MHGDGVAPPSPGAGAAAVARALAIDRPAQISPRSPEICSRDVERFSRELRTIRPRRLSSISATSRLNIISGTSALDLGRFSAPCSHQPNTRGAMAPTARRARDWRSARDLAEMRARLRRRAGRPTQQPPQGATRHRGRRSAQRSARTSALSRRHLPWRRRSARRPHTASLTFGARSMTTAAGARERRVARPTCHVDGGGVPRGREVWGDTWRARRTPTSRRGAAAQRRRRRANRASRRCARSRQRWRCRRAAR